MKTVLVTGSSGLIGSEAVMHYDSHGCRVVGVDNNMRRVFFGAEGDTLQTLSRLRSATKNFYPHDVDIRDRDSIFTLVRSERPTLIIHCAAQPSHDRAAAIPFDDFEVNAMGTLNLLEATRQWCSEAVFIHMSTNKVYGDAPNEFPLVETPTRWEYARPEHWNGVTEQCGIDQCLHSLFGASKLAADVMVQEYGRYFGLRTGVFRGGCLTGPNHAGVQLHGFLNYLTRVAVENAPYTVYGYRGKQVRDQIHSSDVIAAFEAFANDPRPGEVYNLGGGRDNSASILEIFQMLEARLNYRIAWEYRDEPRRGDHICYISDLRKIKRDFPGWTLQYSLDDIVDELIQSVVTRS